MKGKRRIQEVEKECREWLKDAALCDSCYPQAVLDTLAWITGKRDAPPLTQQQWENPER